MSYAVYMKSSVLIYIQTGCEVGTYMVLFKETRRRSTRIFKSDVFTNLKYFKKEDL